MSDSLNERRRRLVAAMIRHVPFDGWSRKALLAGARDAGMTPETADRAFPGGLAQAAEVYSALADERMVAAMEESGVIDLPVRERIALGVRLRLEAAAPEREAIRHLMTYLAMPGRGLLAAKLTARTVDAIWYAAGDTATDFNYYTKRGLLAAVYTSTVLYWINDASEDCEATWGFLDRRIADVMTIPKLQARAAKAVGRLPSPLKLMRAFARPAAARR